MKILRLASYYNPEKVASSHLYDDLDKRIVDEGHELIIITPTPSRNIDEEVRLQYKRDKFKKSFDYDHKISIIRFPLFKEPRNTLYRTLRYFLQIIRQYRIAKKIDNIELIITDSTPPIVGLVGAKLSRKINRPFIYLLQDIFPDSLLNTKKIKGKGVIWSIGRKIENHIYNYAMKIIVISEEFKMNLLNKKVPIKKIEVIPNWINLDNLEFISRDKNYLFEQYKIDKNKFIISYCGNLGHTQNLDLLIAVANMMKEDTNVLFVLVGDGNYKSNLVKKASENNLNNVIFIPYQPKECISQVYSIGDVGLVISKKGIGSNSVPSKFYTMLAASQMVLASFDNDTTLCRTIRDNKCGICILPDNQDLLKDSIVRLYNDRKSVKIMANNGYSYVKNLNSKDYSLSKYIDIINEIK